MSNYMHTGTLDEKATLDRTETRGEIGDYDALRLATCERKKLESE